MVEQNQKPPRARDPAQITEDTEFRRAVYKHIAKYAKPDDTKAWFHLITSLVLLAGFWALGSNLPLDNYWGIPLFVVLAILAGGVRVRIFILFHDMAHHNYFSSDTMNMIVATLIGVIDYTPYTGWKNGHDYHHRHSNKTDRKQYAQTAPWDVEQFSKAPTWVKMLYTFVYSKYTLFTLSPLLYFSLYNRMISVWYENLLQLAWIVCFWNPALFSTQVLLFDVVSGWIAISSGFFLFHVQHTFEGAYKSNSKSYDRFMNGMWGSSFLEVPWYLQFFTGRIEYHNIHHLNTKVPFYKLKECWDDGYEDYFKGTVSRLTLWEALNTIPYSVRNDKDLSFFDVTQLWNTKSVF
eukprot:gb/GECH01011429.1/.p1 GENE.gb/GECH01011429.1/~~gb/GECH01011429.1/.p1  ORF type:complete len:350 (+),score=29.42 gb/GECH01011429.1/:1-1050(+)